MMKPLEFKLETFEGPLDLLLHLISRHKLDICDIEISELLTQYLAYMDQMQQADLEIASEFLEMAARLVYIKTVSLLPRLEEAEELKRELQGQLLEYQLCREMAAKLAQRRENYAVFVRLPQPLPIDMTYRNNHDAEELLSSYLITAGKAQRRLPPPVSAFTPLVRRRFVSVTQRIAFLLSELYRRGSVLYQEMFASNDRSEQVATFLAVLELIKSSRIRLSDDNRTLSFVPGASMSTEEWADEPQQPDEA